MARFKALGVWFCIDFEESKKKNYEEKVHKVEDILNNWRNKKLTLIGKIAVSCITSCLYSFFKNVMFKIWQINK